MGGWGKELSCNSWHLKSLSVAATLWSTLLVCDAVADRPIIPLTHCSVIDISGHLRSYGGSCIHPADIWLSVTIASLRPKFLSGALAPLWTHCSDVPRLQAADVRGGVSSWLWRTRERFMKWRGVLILLEGWLFSSARRLMVQPFPLKLVEVTLWTRRERVHSKIIFTVLPRLLFPVVFAWKCSNQN